MSAFSPMCEWFLIVEAFCHHRLFPKIDNHMITNTTIHWPYYCTVHYVALIFYDSMWSFSMKTCLCSFFNRLFIYVLPLEIQLSRREGWDKLTGWTPPYLCACSRPRPGFPTSHSVIVSLCSVSEGERCLFVFRLYWWNCW